MSERNSFRLSVIAGVFLVALAIIFSPVIYKVFHPSSELTSWVKLNPGIDMVGGTSLVYEIKKPEGGARDAGDLATKVAEVLKKRVDPNGVKNLIWRPQGSDRLEIQMPLPPDAQQNAAKRRELREQIISAADKLEAGNIRPEEVTDAVEQKNGKTQKDLDRLAGDSTVRKELFQKLVTAWNKVQAAHAAQNADDEARARIEYDNLLHPANKISPITATNLTREDLDNALSSPDKDQELKAIKDRFGDSKARRDAIDNYVKAQTALLASKDTIDDANDIKRQLKGSGLLEFHILADDAPPAERQKMTERLMTYGPRVQAGDTTRWFLVDKPEEFKRQTVEYNKKFYILCWTTPEHSLDHHPGMNEWHLTDARADSNPQTAELVVDFTFDPQGGAYFGDLTQKNIGRPMAIVLDGKVISAPNINSQIHENGQITGGKGGFTHTELDYLVSTLKAGSLPARLADEPISERTVGPQLGQDNLHKGLVACLLGIVVVAVFLCSYYFLAGFVATFAVIMNVALVLAVMSAFGATFTLPSIAGIVLSVGTAVDANVLIFERLREEQHRGLSLRMALRNAYDKAFSAIIDSNMTTVITSLTLIMFGTEEVKGFGVTLIIGIAASLFTALFVTRTIFNVLIEKFGINQLRSLPLVFPKWDKMLRPNIDWMGLAKYFIAFSCVAIVIGLAMFYKEARAGHVMDIEFASGTSVTIELKDKMSQTDLRKLVDAKADPAGLPAPSVVTVGNDEKTYEIVTPNSDAVKVKETILKTLVDSRGQSLLKVEVPSKYDGSGETVSQQMNKAVIPLTDKQTTLAAVWPGGFRPADVGDYVGGVAIVLNHIEPPLTAGQIADRIKQQQLQLPANSPAAHLSFAVEAPGGSDRPTSLAVVLSRDDSLPYAQDPIKWEEQVAGPLWGLTDQSVNRPAQLQQVKNFDAQVASDTTRDALMALTLSIIVIMAYIWFRFGNLKYGTATVAALLHDVLFTIAALGFAHYLYQVPVLGKALGLEAFRINLTVVAGILTIMGYSMIDTIVVFDRIRENRGKFGHVSRKVVNDAINQTLSRTLLTAGTNVATVAIMYFFGGTGIHGFTFVLLIGILVGTYSSIAIAAPILLMGRRLEEQPTTRASGRVQRAGA
ncbi:MAG: secD secF [Phycisphaerales bacterium]|nr:secD secF [Phycisphaerales bacterium]